MVPLVNEAFKIAISVELYIDNVLEVIDNAFGFTNAKPINNDTEDLTTLHVSILFGEKFTHCVNFIFDSCG